MRPILSGTRAIKNLRFLQQQRIEALARGEQVPDLDAAIPSEALQTLHRRTAMSIVKDPAARAFLTKLAFPPMATMLVDPIFSGTVYFAQVKFTVQSMNNAVVQVSTADINTAIRYSERAVPAISQFVADQYGSNQVNVSTNILPYSVVLPGPSFTDAQLVSWIDKIALQNALPPNSCLVVLVPQGITNSSVAANVGGYHSRSTVPFIFSRTFGSNFTVADQLFSYAFVLSHELAETIVDPNANLLNPEVCDPCAGNCLNTFVAFFDENGDFIATLKGGTALPPGYAFYINAIVTAAEAFGVPCPDPDNKRKVRKCSYFPPSDIWAAAIYETCLSD